MTTEAGPEPLWQDDAQALHMRGRVMRWLLDARQADDDQLARHCLTVEELSAVVPEHVRANRAADTVEGLAEFLDPEGDVKPLAGAIRDWRISLEMVRGRFGWLELPPAVRRRAVGRARAMMDRAADQGFVERADGLWRLTPAGIAHAQAVQNG